MREENRRRLQRFYRERLRAEKRALRELEWLHGEEEEEAAEKEKAWTKWLMPCYFFSKLIIFCFPVFLIQLILILTSIYFSKLIKCLISFYSFKFVKSTDNNLC